MRRLGRLFVWLLLFLPLVLELLQVNCCYPGPPLRTSGSAMGGGAKAAACTVGREATRLDYR